MPRPRHLVLVAIASLALAACGGSGTATPTAAPPAATAAAPTGGAPGTAAPSVAAAECTKTDQTGGVAVTIANFDYSPGTIQAKVGQPITWTNQDTANHGAIMDDGGCTTGSFGKGKSGSVVFSIPGTYTYHCPVHGQTMTGTVEVSS